ncbi:C_GCAxxG_C_C family probable redox protein [Geothermobacter ehrlichii]|uniref:C_GCAxxG_C_C family probable redox protein n=1 Tax=Geothermobacter ehrlichii TaxID=213224 RepID=A0A5D3WGG6_9BACT|nr:C-GCAxxG-C-C family protein [Geothermobacter ehrlichii]TYO95207.1 C_GCAxxG_C_C family probable redox protein [Geothermobacter ehrlichii]
MRLFGCRAGKKSDTESDESVAEKAGRLFDRGNNCAQAVLQATLGIDDPRLLDVAAAFGSGIGGQKCLCGAVSGGVMALGLAGRPRLAGRLVAKFRRRNRTTCCKALSAPFRWMSREHLANCRRLTAETATLVNELLRG